MLDDESMQKYFKELVGEVETKPFECVGTYSEIRYSVSSVIKSLESQNAELPYLLKYYKENYELSNENLLKYYNEEHNVPEEFERILKERLK